VKPVAFDYAAAKDSAAAIALLVQADGAKLIAGGQSLGPMLNLRLARPLTLVDVLRAADMRGARDEGDTILYGGAVTHAEVEDGVVPDATSGWLAAVARRIAYRGVRNRGTIGGSLAHADPAADWVNVLTALGGEVVKIDLTKPMSEILATLTRYPIRTRLSLTGPMIVARDIAHAKIRARLEAGEPMPEYFKNHPVYYAGPAKTPAGYASGSFGPTTAGRMDSYVDQFQAAGGSMVMLAKGNRSAEVRNACAKHGGFYLGSIGGPAARLAQDCIRSVEVLEYPELGMEAIWKIEVEDFPAFIVVDDKGNDFFADPSGQTTVPLTGVRVRSAEPS